MNTFLLWDVLAALGYLATMTWATMLAPPGAGLPAIIILHGAIVVLAMVSHERDRTEGKLEH